MVEYKVLYTRFMSWQNRWDGAHLTNTSNIHFKPDLDKKCTYVFFGEGQNMSRKKCVASM